MRNLTRYELRVLFYERIKKIYEYSMTGESMLSIVELAKELIEYFEELKALKPEKNI